MELFKLKYENVEFTYYDPKTQQLYHHVTTRLKHITNGDYSQYMENPVGHAVIKLGRKMITVQAAVIAESFTKQESDIKMLNHIWGSLDTKTFTNTRSIPAAIARLKKQGINVHSHNSEIERCVA
jgi:hypothetical protein